MSRREKTVYRRCDDPGCTDRGIFTYTAMREYARIMAEPYLCLKHTRPDAWLTPANTTRTVVLTASRIPSRGSGFLNCLSWIE